MRIKISGIKTIQDMQTAVAAGADAVGFMVGQLHQSADFILPSTAGRLAAELPPLVTSVLVTHLFNVDEIVDLVAKTRIHTVQLHGRMSVEKVKELCDRMPPDGRLIMAAYIARGQIPDVVEYYPFLSSILLDAGNLAPELIETEDHSEYFWNQAAEFTARCPLPVILTGGLGPENVAEAVKIVKPFAVDANRRLKGEPGGACLPELCRSFVANATATA